MLKLFLLIVSVENGDTHILRDQLSSASCEGLAQEIAMQAQRSGARVSCVAGYQYGEYIVEHEGRNYFLPPCHYEDSPDCVWHATQRGNGTGRSFYDIGGTAYYLDPVTLSRP